MSMRLRTAFGHPRAPPGALDTNAASIVRSTAGDLKTGINSVASSRLLLDATLFPQVLVRRRRPIFHRINSRAHQTRIINNLWQDRKSEYGRRWMVSTAQQSGENLSSTADDGFDVFVRDGREDAAQELSSGGEGQKEMGKLVEHPMNPLKTEERKAMPQKRGCGSSSSHGSFERGIAYRTEYHGQIFSLDKKVDGLAHVTECLHSELNRLTHVFESSVQNFLTILRQHELKIRQKVKSNGCAGKIRDHGRLIDHSRLDSRTNRQVERRGASIIRYGMNGKEGSLVTREAELREMTPKGEVGSGVSGKLSERKFELHEHSNAENASEDEDKRFMMEALVEAKKAAMAGEVPVGCVVVQNRKIIARAYNRS